MSPHATAVAVKYAPAVVAAPLGPFISPWLGYLPFNPWWPILMAVATFFALVARAGRAIQQEKTAREVRRDLFVSLLAAGGNLIIAATIIRFRHLDYLEGFSTSFVCVFIGIRGLVEGVKVAGLKSVFGVQWVWRHMVEDSGREAQEEQKRRALDSLEAGWAKRRRGKGTGDETD